MSLLFNGSLNTLCVFFLTQYSILHIINMATEVIDLHLQCYNTSVTVYSTYDYSVTIKADKYDRTCLFVNQTKNFE